MINHSSDARPVKTTRYQVTLSATAGDIRPPAVRLRQLLKLALRACGLRCLDCQELPAEPDEGGPS